MSILIVEQQMVNRALSFAMSDPKGPVYLCGAREAMEVRNSVSGHYV